MFLWVQRRGHRKEERGGRYKASKEKLKEA